MSVVNRETLFAGKFPGAYLNELCAKRLVGAPMYTERQIGTVFESTVTVKNYRHEGEIVTATDTGTKKQLARHKAAAKVLGLLGHKPDAPSASVLTTVLAISSTNETPTNDEADGTNVQKLANFCSEKYYKGPVYEDIKTEGPDHERWYYVGCRVWRSDGTEIVVEDYSNKKQKAKAKAATKMLRTLEAEPPVNVPSTSIVHSAVRTSMSSRPPSTTGPETMEEVSSETSPEELMDVEELETVQSNLAEPSISSPTDVATSNQDSTSTGDLSFESTEEVISSQSAQILEKFCADKFYQPPVFEETSEGPSHRPTFRCKYFVTVAKGRVVKVEEVDNQKKKAKLKAAHEMLQQLKLLAEKSIVDVAIQALSSVLKEKQVKLNSTLEKYKIDNNCQDEVIVCKRKQYCIKYLSHQHHGYRVLKGPLITDLRTNMKSEISDDSEEVLSKIGEEEKFDLLYEPLICDPEPRVPRQQCYLTITFRPKEEPDHENIHPPYPVFMAEGYSEIAAKKRVAGEALNFLVHITQP